MYYSYVEIEYVATSIFPARIDLALKLLRKLPISLRNAAGRIAILIANRKLGQGALGNLD